MHIHRLLKTISALLIFSAFAAPCLPQGFSIYPSLKPAQAGRHRDSSQFVLLYADCLAGGNRSNSIGLVESLPWRLWKTLC